MPQEQVTPQPEKASSGELVRGGEFAPQPENTESGLRWPVLIQAGKGRLQIEEIAGSEYRFHPDTELPEVKIGERWQQVKGALSREMQERFVLRWAEAPDPERPLVLQEAQDFFEYLEGMRRQLYKDQRHLRAFQNDLSRYDNEKEVRKIIMRGVKRSQFASEKVARVEIGHLRQSLSAKIERLSAQVALDEQSLAPFGRGPRKKTAAAEARPVPALEVIESLPDDELEGPLEEEVAVRADEGLPATAPLPELQKTLALKYREVDPEGFKEWMLATLRDNAPDTKKVLDKEVAVGLAESTLERESKEDLTAVRAAVKIDQDRLTALEVLPEGAEKPVGQEFAQEVAKIVKEEKPKVAPRRFLPGFILERVRGLLTISRGGEVAEAVRFKRATNDIARVYLESVQDRALFGAEGTSGSMVDQALVSLRERLGKLRTFSGEAMQQQITAKEAEVRALLEQELSKAEGLVNERDISALAEKLRNNLDRRYWWRYVVGAAEVAVAGAVGGYFLFWKGAATGATELGPRVAKTAAKRVARQALKLAVQARPSPFQLPGISTELPPVLTDHSPVHGSLWATVRRAAHAAGLKPNNGQLLDMTKRVAQENGIAVSEWGIAGKIKDTAVPDGMLLRGVRAVLKELATNA